MYRQSREVPWPPRYPVIGVGISATTYDNALEVVTAAAQGKISSCVTHLAVHGLVTGSRESGFRSMLEGFDIVAPDGQPVRYALNLLYGRQLPDRCYGPEFMLRVCKRMAELELGVYLYGSHRHVVEALRDNLAARYTGIRIVGCEPSLFRPLTAGEDEALVNRINASGAGVVFIGLGCPLQEKFAFEHKGGIEAVQICVGAAFDFHAANKKMAPVWMQKLSLEWLFRLAQEPRRLWQRYLYTNSFFLLKLLSQYIRMQESYSVGNSNDP